MQQDRQKVQDKDWEGVRRAREQEGQRDALGRIGRSQGQEGWGADGKTGRGLINSRLPSGTGCETVHLHLGYLASLGLTCFPVCKRRVFYRIKGKVS